MKRSARQAVAVILVCTSAAAATRPSSGGAPAPFPSLELAAIDRKVADADGRLRSDRGGLAQLVGRVAIAHARLIAHGRAYYLMTRAGLLPVSGGFGALVTHAMHVERARRVVTADAVDERRFHARAESLEHEIEQLERDRAALSGQRLALQAAISAREDDLRREAEFDQAFHASGGAVSGYVPVAGGTVATEMPAGGFASAQGRLLLPVAARAEVRPARREGTSGPGLEFLVPAGTPVRAPFAGRVAFADRYGPYGRIVILDHGDHYFTVNGNLDEIDVRVGQDVGAADRIGTVGDDGKGPMLYFEVRHGSQTIAPSPWLGL